MSNITFVDFRKGEAARHVHTDIWQWNYGQILRIQGLNLPSAVEIHFSLDENTGEAARRIGITDSGVTDVVIPDFILEGYETAKDHYLAYAFVYLSDGESGKTIHKIVMKIKTRPRPEGTAPSDDTTFGAIMEAVRKIAERTGGTVSDEQIQAAVDKFLTDNPIDGLTQDELAAAIKDYFDVNPVKVEKENYFADFGVTTYDAILEAIDKGQHVLARYENKHYALSSVSTTTIVFETASNNIIRSLAVSSKSVWSNSSTELQTVGSRMKTMDGVTNRDDLYPSVKAVADYTEKKMEQKMDKPSTAVVGQMVVVKKIDENGKPIEFEAVNVPEGGSDATVTEESIKSALGYTPANESIVDELSGQKVDEKHQYQTLYMKSPNGTVYSVKIDDNGKLYVDGVVPDEDIPEDLLEGRLLVWNDEFEGDSVNTDNWMFRMDNATRTNTVVIADSVMDMPCYYSEETGVWHDYYMHSSGCKDVKFGRLEAKMKWDAGTMSAFWTIGQTSQKYNGVTEGIIWPRAGEIDIFESDGTNLYTTLHYGENEGAGIAHDSRKIFAISDLITEKGIDPSEWHRYAVEWTDDEMVFYVDDVEFGRTDNDIVYLDGTKPFSMPHYLLISCYAKDTSDTSVVQHCYVDWVRYYAPVGITKEIPIESILLNESSISLNPNRVRELELTIEPDYVTDYTMRWYSTDRSIAKFNAGNRIETLKEGNVELSVVTKDGLTAKCDLVVSNEVVNNVTGITLDYGTSNVGYVGNIMTITATVTPKWATYLECDWESSDTNVATVDNGIVSFVGDGNVTITAKAKDTGGVTASVELVSVAELTDNIDTDGCVVKFTRSGWGADDNGRGLWESDIEGIDSLQNEGNVNHFGFEQGEGYCFTSITSPSALSHVPYNAQIDDAWSMAIRVKVYSGAPLGNDGTPIIAVRDTDATTKPWACIALQKNGKYTFRLYDENGTALINKYSQTPVVFDVDSSNIIQADKTINFIAVFNSDMTYTLYANGEVLCTGTATGVCTMANPIMCLGEYKGKNRQVSPLRYQAMLGYNRALTADEVTALNTALDEMYA